MKPVLWLKALSEKAKTRFILLKVALTSRDVVVLYRKGRALNSTTICSSFEMKEVYDYLERNIGRQCRRIKEKRKRIFNEATNEDAA